MPALKEETFAAKKNELMEKSYECFAETGLHGTGIRALGQYCGCNTTVFYTYFKDLNDLIVQSTGYSMNKVADELMTVAPTSIEDLDRFLDEVPHWTAEKHGKKYRLMYQVYTHPKYREYGKEFFRGVNQRYSDYAASLSDVLGIPVDILRPMIFTFVRAVVHYALFEDEFYLQEQIRLLKQTVALFKKELTAQAGSGTPENI